jgi:hypothetical protein
LSPKSCFSIIQTALLFGNFIVTYWLALGIEPFQAEDTLVAPLPDYRREAVDPAQFSQRIFGQWTIPAPPGLV